MSLRRCLHLLAALIMVLLATNARAHTSATSFLNVRIVDDSTVAAAFDIDLRDLQYLLNLDADGDEAITWGEVLRATPAIRKLAQSHTRFNTTGGTCSVNAEQPIALAEHGDGPYAHLVMALSCPAPTRSLSVDYAGWFSLDAQHRALLEVTSVTGAHEQSILTATTPRWQGSETQLARVARFLREGVHHLLTGYDHLAFLSVLLLGLVRRGDLANSGGVWGILRRSLAVITAFTLAHSITLALAANGVLVLPSRPVEVAIAISVVVTALLNLSPAAGKHGWKLAFIFGLVHGLGFAGALAESTTERIDLTALAAFNIGIELAQIACALVVIPLLWWLLKHARSERVFVPLASLVVAAVAMQWVIARIAV